jgi:hypothetical protein
MMALSRPHHVVEFAPVGHVKPVRVHLLPEHEGDERLADGPEMDPHVTSRPPPLSERTESFQVTAPTFSMTTSTPRLSVACA